MTEAEIFTAVKAHHDPGEFVVLPQVRNQAGFARTVRTADAVAVSCFPSKGIGAHGFEFKDSRADWLKELKDGGKSEEIGRFCSKWSVVASGPAIVKPDEVPEAWGWFEVAEGRLKRRKTPPTRPAAEPTWAFFAALVRAARAECPEAEVERRVAAAVRQANEGEWRRRDAAVKAAEAGWKKEQDGLLATVEAFEEASGVTIRLYGNRVDHARKVGEAVRFVMAGGLAGLADRLEPIRGKIMELVERADKVTAELRGEAPKDHAP